MIAAGAPSTGGWVVPAPPGVVILAPSELPRNAEGHKVKAALQLGTIQRGQGAV
jgi:hypothetical protein